MPINVANGNVHLEFEDVSIPGKFDLVWERCYSGSLLGRRGGILVPDGLVVTRPRLPGIPTDLNT